METLLKNNCNTVIVIFAYYGLEFPPYEREGESSPLPLQGPLFYLFTFLPFYL